MLCLSFCFVINNEFTNGFGYNSYCNGYVMISLMHELEVRDDTSFSEWT